MLTEYAEIYDALVEMVWQFAYRTQIDGKDVLSTGGLSTLEQAFDVLEIPDPCSIDHEIFTRGGDSE